MNSKTVIFSIRSLALCAIALAFQNSWAVSASIDGGNQSSSGSSAYNPLLLDTLSPTATGGYEIPANGSIAYDYVAGSGRYTWTVQNTAGVIGSPIPVNTTYAVIQYATVGTGGNWTGWYAGMSECCWQVRGVDIIDVGTNASVTNLSFVNNAADRSVTYSFDPVSVGTVLEIHNIMVYTMPIPLVTDGDKLFHATPLTAIPVPAAVWMFGSAVGVLGWVRRRNRAKA